MEQIVITHLDGSTLLLQSKTNISAITSATQQVELLGADLVDITVISAKKLNFYIGDKITVFGRDYTLNIHARERKTSENQFQYILQFEGVQYDLLRPAYNVNIDTTNNEIQDVSGDSLTGDLERFMDVLISNANRVFPGKWVLGTCPANTETKTLTFKDSDNCLSVLQDLCREDNYNTEFSIEIDGNGVRTINIGVVGTTHTTTFTYGKGHGIYELTREKQTNSNIITRLHVFGSSKNITSKYRCSKLCLPGKSKAESYIENADAIAAYGIWENAKTFEEVFPHRTGVISALGASVYQFVDSSMDFDLNEKEADDVTTKYLMVGASAKVHFNTGNLAGYEFEISGYDHITKTFTLLKLTDERDMTFPSESSSAFQFSVGDQYVILDIYMPQSYIDTAEAELETKGTEYHSQNSQPKVQYGLTIDPICIRKLYGETPQNIFWVGDYIPIQDQDIAVDKSIRLKGFRRDLLEEFDYNLTISDLPVTVNTITKVISEVIDFDKIIRFNNLRDPARARRNWKATSELVTMIETVQAEAALIGNDPAGQFDLSGVAIKCNYNGDANNFYASDGSLVHYYYPIGNPGTWNITALNAGSLTPSSAYFLYVKASKTDTSAVFILSSTKIPVENVAGYYHFPVGILSSVIDGIRTFQTTKGFTLISGDSIKTGVLQGNGITIDMNEGTISGIMTFTSGSSGYDNLADKPDLSGFALESEVNTLINGLQTQIDGNITTWFYAYEPTLANVPASNWTTDIIKDAHLGDLFYNTITGYAYRFQKVSGVFSWQKLSDSDISAALAAAASAQDTADGKRRVFVVQPVPPYDIGDLWSQGTSGDLMKCKTAKLEGQSYNSSDWEKASKYTDDTVASTKARTFIQSTAPTSGMQTGDYWLDSDENYKTYVYRAGAWGVDPAQTAADNAQTTANAKRRCFVAQPAPPYDIGDLWVQGTSGDLYRCQTARATGSYNAADWVKAVKYTDDTTANTKSRTLIQTTAPSSGMQAGDWWLDSDDGYKAYVYRGSQWILETAQSTADSKARHFNVQPTPPYDAGKDTWTNGTDLFICAVSRASGSYQAGDFVKATGYDNTVTTINGGMVTSGTIQLAGDDQNIKAGITGQGTADSSIRFWAGNTYANRAMAPFRVNQAGQVTATDIVLQSSASGDRIVIDGDDAIKLYQDGYGDPVVKIAMDNGKMMPYILMNGLFKIYPSSIQFNTGPDLYFDDYAISVGQGRFNTYGGSDLQVITLTSGNQTINLGNGTSYILAVNGGGTSRTLYLPTAATLSGYFGDADDTPYTVKINIVAKQGNSGNVVVNGNGSALYNNNGSNGSITLGACDVLEVLGIYDGSSFIWQVSNLSS